MATRQQLRLGSTSPHKSWSECAGTGTSESMDTVQASRSFRPVLRPGTRFDSAAARRPLLVFQDVHKAYTAGSAVLRGLNLEIERGEFVFFTGPSGAGKSTLLRMLYAAESIDSGRILFMCREVGRMPVFEQLRPGLCVQRPAQDQCIHTAAFGRTIISWTHSLLYVTRFFVKSAGHAVPC